MSSPKAPSQTTTTTKVELPEWVQPYSRQLLDQGVNLANKPYEPYIQPKIAPLTQEHQFGLDRMVQRAAAGSPEMAQAGDMFRRTIGGEYLNSNPYLDATINKTLGDVTQNWRQTVGAQTDRNASMAGAFGGSVHNELMTDNNAKLARELGGISSGMRMQNYDQERGRQMQMLGMAPTFAQDDYNDVKMLMGAGDIIRDATQDQYTSNYESWQDAQNYPYKQLELLASTIAGAVGNASTTSQTAPNPYRPNTATNILGGMAMMAPFMSGMFR